MAIVVRHSRRRFREPLRVMTHGLRERSRPGRTSFFTICAVYLTAQRPHVILVAGIEDPYAPRGVPHSAEAASPEREIRVVGTADSNAAVLLFDDQRRHSTSHFQSAGPITRSPRSWLTSCEYYESRRSRATAWARDVT